MSETKRERYIRELTRAAKYPDKGMIHVTVDAAREIVDLLKEQEKEIKALRKLLDWAMECDFGIDNLGDWWTERFAEEIKEMGYTESLIHLAKRYIEVFEGGEDDA